MKLLIHGKPNKEVTLSNDKYRKTLTINENREAVFTLWKSGTYIAEITLDNGGKFRKEIAVFNEFHEDLPNTQVKSLPLKSKIKFSNGLKMILMNKDLTYHQQNSVTLVSEFIVEDVRTNGVGTVYGSGTFQTVLKKYFDGLMKEERDAFLTFDVPWDRYKNDGKITQHFYCPSIYAMGLKTWNNPDIDVNIGFTDNASRIKKYQDGRTGRYFSSYVYNWYANNRLEQWFIKADGDHYQEFGSGMTAGIVPCCDISQEAYVALDSDGYYRILGM